jgi:15-cis-phytoene synthase
MSKKTLPWAGFIFRKKIWRSAVSQPLTWPRRRSMLARIRPLLAMEADRARECYRAGEELIPLVNEDSQPALWVLITIYRRLLEKLRAKQYDVFGERVRFTVPEKLTVMGKGILKRLL